jgi:hypothetical protein
MPKIKPPWSEREVAHLWAWQAAEHLTPVTCPATSRDAPLSQAARHDVAPVALVPTRRGWVCPSCGAVQDWAWQHMLDGPPPPTPARPDPDTE